MNNSNRRGIFMTGMVVGAALITALYILSDPKKRAKATETIKKLKTELINTIQSFMDRRRGEEPKSSVTRIVVTKPTT